MFERQKAGSVVCPSCGRLVEVNEEKCPYCGRAKPGMFGFTKSFQGLGGDGGFLTIVFWGCGLIFVASLLLDPSALTRGGFFNFLSPSNESLVRLGASGTFPIFGQGHWWTVLSAGWLHGSLLHIGFNLMALRSLGPLTVQLYGAGRFMIVFTAGSIVGFVLSSVVGLFAPVLLASPLGFLFGLVFTILGKGAYLTIGASAGLCGLIGALFYYSRRGGSTRLGEEVKRWVISILIFGILLPNIDNWGHLGGMVGGYVAARFLDPLKPERTDHYFLAAACLIASGAAILASFFAG
jgi:rhomboid protease GluP